MVSDNPTPTWAVPQEFAPTSSYQVRDELGAVIARDLLGPWGGESEELGPRVRGPRERYLVGILGPRHTPRGSESDASVAVDLDLGVAAEAEPELPETPSSQTLGTMWASTAGLSFSVATDVDAVAVQVSWGQYGKVESVDDDGKAVRVWRREPISHPREVRLDEGPDRRVWLEGDEANPFGVWVSVLVRRRGDCRVVRLTLVNGRRRTQPDDAGCLFQAGFVVTALDGAAAVFEPIDDPLDTAGQRGADAEEQHLRLLYRDSLRHAVGHNVAVRTRVPAGGRRAIRLETVWLPTHDVPQTSADNDALAGLRTSMDFLAALADPTGLTGVLAPLVDGYAAWLDGQSARIAGLPGSLRPAAEGAVHAARRVHHRIAAGVALLVADPQARQAFRFANEAMAMQRRNTAAAALRAKDPDLSAAAALARINEQGVLAASWRPFQLAFILLNLPALTDPGHAERSAEAGLVDLLFFPTGGGKTEAYLGLTAYTFAIRRLQGVIGSGVDARDGGDGVAVLMRYTLRLLTAQQFQRAASLVCAAEMIRARDPGTWGRERFRIGLWVGRSVAPNWYPDAAQQVADARESGRGERVSVLQTLSCPWCGARLRGQRDLVPHEQQRRVVLYCDEGEGAQACPFSRTQAPGEGLPIHTIDEEVYRYPPSLLIATVDKLAQLPWYGFAGLLFGRVQQRCPRHGYRHPDLDERTGCADRHHAASGLEPVQSVAVTRLRPPDLIIQDELHLISGALGTTVGLFEGAVAELCRWPLPGGRDAGPKVVASTATTRRAAEQVRRVFAADLAVFPPQVLDVGDNFFSRQIPASPEKPGRRYLGVCAHGTRLKAVEIRLAELLLMAGQTLFDRYGKPADPYLTMVGYFSSVRELAGMRRLVDDDVAVRVRTGDRKGLSDRLVSKGELLRTRELTSRINAEEIAAVLGSLEIEFDQETDTTARRRGILGALVAGEKDLPQARRAVDVALATSMLQVGVDIARFGLMVVTGQPKNTAEYIQASSRVGRDGDNRPGLVITLYNWTRPRDLAHYEDFDNYHATFYRQVEALSVTPYARRALDRGTAATVISAIRQASDANSVNVAAHDVDLDSEQVRSVIGRLLARAERAEPSHGQRARDYFDDRIAALLDSWRTKRTGATRLGYDRSAKKALVLVPLLDPAGSAAWTTTTVGRSMRETENEINLLVPGTGLFDPVYGSPPWRFGPEPSTSDVDGTDVADGAEAEEGEPA